MYSKSYAAGIRHLWRTVQQCEQLHAELTQAGMFISADRHLHASLVLRQAILTACRHIRHQRYADYIKQMTTEPDIILL